MCVYVKIFRHIAHVNVVLTWDMCCVVHRCVDHHRWYARRCDEACGAGCEGLRPEQLHAGPDRGYRSSNLGNNSQQGRFGAFRRTINTLTHVTCLCLVVRFITCIAYSLLLPSFLSSSSSSLSAGMLPSPLFDRHQGPGPNVLPR